MILAMNGVDLSAQNGFGELGAVSQSIADLQTALVAFGKAIGSSALSIAIDGLIGPKTAAAVNHALTVNIGAGQVPANLRTGSLSQAVIVSQAATITNVIDAEIARRGFSTPVSKKIIAKTTRPATATNVVSPPPAVRYTPPAPAAAAVTPIYRVPAPAPGTDMSEIIKWSAIGVGAVALLGAGYYLMTRQRQPGMAGCGLGGSPPADKSGPYYVFVEKGKPVVSRSLSRALRAGQHQGFNYREDAEYAAKQRHRESIGFTRKRQPGMAGLGDLSIVDRDALEKLMDKSENIKNFLGHLEAIAYVKADHVSANWQDAFIAKRWTRLGKRFASLARTVKDPYT